MFDAANGGNPPLPRSRSAGWHAGPGERRGDQVGALRGDIVYATYPNDGFRAPRSSGSSREVRFRVGRSSVGVRGLSDTRSGRVLRWPLHSPFAVALVATGILTGPLAVVSAILGRLPIRGALLAATLVFAVSWTALTNFAHSTRETELTGARPHAARRR